MSKKMLVNATHLEENRVAIVADGILTELDIEVSGREPTKGNIYKAVVVRVEPGLQAAFVDYGAERLGFLQIDEVNFETVKPGSTGGENGRSRPRINDLLHRGQELLVQITKEERGTKGAALTTYLSLAGRYMVCMPGSQTRGVSRKVESDAERKQLKKAMAEVDLPEGFGYIVRTAGLGKTKEELQRDFNYLKRLYDGIRELGTNAKAPALIYKESNLVIRSIRDYFTTDMDEVLIDDPDVFKEAKDFFERVMPEYGNLVKLHQERRPIFSRYQIEDQIETINQSKVPLSSGGSIVIDPTEALVSIDVNSGKMTSEQGVESTAFKTNLEAAEEIGRQLRLRDLGGLIVIDFIDMRDNKHNRAVENQLRQALASDKARISVGRISKFGLLEMSRQRIKGALAEGSSLTCPHCQGSGRIKSPESLAVGLVRRIHAGVARGQISRVDAKLPLDVASYLLNDKREDLHDMERRYNVQIHVHGFPNYLTEQIEIDFKKREKEKQAAQEYVEAGSLSAVIEAADETSRAEPEADVENDDKSKKKRRRRRRKPAADKATQEPAQQPAKDAPPSEQPPVEQVEGQTVAAEENSTDKETGPPDQPQEASSSEAKKPKRRRSSRKKAPGEKPAEEQKAAQEASSAEAPAPADEPAAPKPKRPSRARPKVKTEAPADQTAEAGQQSTDAAENAAASASGAKKAEEEKKPRRRRTPRKKAEAMSAPAEDRTSEPATAAAPVQIPEQSSADKEKGSQDEQEPPKPKSRRRSGRSQSSAKAKTASEQPAAESSGPPAATQVAATSAAETKQAEPDKPKRRRAPRRKTDEKEQALSQEAIAESAASDSAATKSDSPAAASASKPQRRRTPRRAAASAKSEPEASDTSEKAQGAAEDKPKRRTRRKSASTATAEETK